MAVSTHKQDFDITKRNAVVEEFELGRRIDYRKQQLDCGGLTSKRTQGEPPRKSPKHGIRTNPREVVGLCKVATWPDFLSAPPRKSPKHGIYYIYSFPFILGSLVTLTGFFIGFVSDQVLLRIRRTYQSYQIPFGGLFEYVSCPHFLGESLEWIGFCIACNGSLESTSFAIWTIANLVPRALAQHVWYQSTFKDYPKHRKEIVPFWLWAVISSWWKWSECVHFVTVSFQRWTSPVLSSWFDKSNPNGTGQIRFLCVFRMYKLTCIH